MKVLLIDESDMDTKYLLLHMWEIWVPPPPSMLSRADTNVVINTTCQRSGYYIGGNSNWFLSEKYSLLGSLFLYTVESKSFKLLQFSPCSLFTVWCIDKQSRLLEVVRKVGGDSRDSFFVGDKISWSLDLNNSPLLGVKMCGEFYTNVASLIST